MYANVPMAAAQPLSPLPKVASAKRWPARNGSCPPARVLMRNVSTSDTSWTAESVAASAAAATASALPPSAARAPPAWRAAAGQKSASTSAVSSEYSG